MQKEEKGRFLIWIIICGYLSYILFSIINPIYINEFSFPNGFLFWKRDRFMDFFNVNAMVAGRMPYLEHSSSYPPFILLFAWVFSLFADYGRKNAFEVENSIIGWFSYFVFSCICVACIFVIVNRKLKNNIKNKYSNLFCLILTFGLVFSAPMIWLLDRGNYLLLTIVFYLLFIYFYDRNDAVAAIFLGLSIGTKIYPVFLLALFAFDKKWKAILEAVGTALGITACSMLFFKGGYWNNVVSFFQSLICFSNGSDYSNLNICFGVGLTALMWFPFMFTESMSKPKDFPLNIIYIIIGILLIGISVINLRKEQCKWKKIMVLTALMVFLTPNSYMYNLVYFLPVITEFVCSKGQKCWQEYIYIIIFGLLMIPKAYYYFIKPYYGIGVQVVLDAGLVLGIILFYNILDRGTRAVKRVGIKSRMEEKSCLT